MFGRPIYKLDSSPNKVIYGAFGRIEDGKNV